LNTHHYQSTNASYRAAQRYSSAVSDLFVFDDPPTVAGNPGRPESRPFDSWNQSSLMRDQIAPGDD
jgi:hypothetical protein